MAFGQVALFELSASQQVKVTNTGTNPSAISLLLVDADASDFALTQNNCGSTIGPQGQCTAQLRFTPQGTLGAKSTTLRVQANTDVLNVPVTGEAISPVTLSTALLDFPPVSTGGASNLPLTVTNNTNLILSQTRLVTPGGTFAPDGQCAMLAPRSPCTSQVAFAPTLAGEYRATLTTQVMVNGNPFAPPSVSLRGDGVDPGLLQFGADPFASALVDAGTTLLRPFTLSNLGPTMAGPIALALTGSGASAFSIVDAGCTTIPPSGSCTGQLRFAPTANATYNASLVADGGPAGFAFLAMVARGYEAGNLQWVGDAGVWATTNVDAMQTLTLKNVSSGPAAAVTVTLTDAGLYGWRLEPDAGVGGCVNGVTALAPNAECTVNVTYLAGQPSTPNGTSTAVLRASASSAVSGVRVLRGTAAYTFMMSPYAWGFPQAFTLVMGPPTRPCQFKNDSEIQFVATAMGGTQLEFKRESAFDVSRCGGQAYYEIPARTSPNAPGAIRRCNDGSMTWPSDEAQPTNPGGGTSFCLPSASMGRVWGSDATGSVPDACRTTLDRVGRIWLCQ